MSASAGQFCVFDPTTLAVVDLVRPNESEVEALLRLAQHEPGLVVLPLSEALRRRNAAAPRPAGARRRSGS